MTLPYWGMVVPLQMYMLMLASHVLRRYVPSDGSITGTDEERLLSMRHGLAGLRRLCDVDMGYDLRRWHRYLLKHQDNYRHPYASETVRPAILTAIKSPDRLRLVRILEEALARLERRRTETVLALAGGIRADEAFDRLPILADALEDAGCDSSAILGHCRGAEPHDSECWVVDLILGTVRR